MMKKTAALVAAFAFSACFSGSQTVREDKGFIRTADGVRLFYQKVGTASKLVLVPNGMYYFDHFKHLADSTTFVFYDVRNRGFSDAITDRSKLQKGILQDIEDLEIVRKHFGANQVDLIGHSYIGLMIGLYAAKYPQQVNRMVQISPAPPDAVKQYPAHLTYVDPVITDVMSKLVKRQSEPKPDDPIESCKQFWSVVGPINVFNQANVGKIDWGRCDLPNERNFMEYWSEHLFPSIQNIHLTQQDLSRLKAPVLILHGDKDRSAPLGGARDWAMMWPNARLLTLQNVAHAPWIESPDIVFTALRTFLSGNWPENSLNARTASRQDS